MPDGFDPNSMGGAVTMDMAGEGFERGGYVGGGLVDSNDWASIVAANKQALGVYGGAQPMGGGAPGATGIVPAATIPVPKPIEAAKMSMPAQRPSGLSTAMQTGKDIASTYNMGKAGLIGSAPTKEDPAGSAGFWGGQGKMDGQNIFSKAKELFAADGGLIVPRHAYADGGSETDNEVTPYDPAETMRGEDPMKDVLASGSKTPQQLKSAQLSMGPNGQQGGGLLGAAKDVAGLFGTAKMLGEGASWLGSTAIPFLFAADGGRIPAYADGGLVPRQGYALQGATDVPADYSPEADMPSPNAQEAGLVVEKPQDTGSLFAGIEDKYGLPSGYMNRTWQMESGAGQNLYNKGSKAAGHFQFIPGTQKQMDLKDPYDLAESADAAGRYAVQNKRFLQLHGVEEPSAAHLYLAHQQGPLGAIRLLNAKDRPAGEAVGNPLAISGNAGDPNAPGSAFANQIMNKFNGIKEPASGPIPENAPRPPGVMGGTDVRATPSGAEGKKSIGDVVTSEGFIVPALGFLGSMLASDKRNLGQALGEGIMGGVGAYQGQQKLSSDVAKKAAETELERAKIPYTQMQTKAVQAGIYERRFIPDVGWQVINKADNTVFYVTDANMNPIKGTGLESTYEQIPVAAGSVAPKTSTSVITPSGARETDITKLVKPAQNVMEWKPVTSVPAQFQPKTHMGTQQDEESAKANLAEGAKLSEMQSGKSEAASRQRMNLQQMMDDFNKLSDSSFQQVGSGAEARLNAAKAINTAYSAMTGGKTIFDPNDTAALESIKKGSFRLGASLANSIGTREPGYIVAQSVQANPNIDNTPTGFKLLASGLLQNALYEQDKKAFYDEYFSRFKHLRGASQEFDKVNPPEMYAKRAIMSAVDPAVIDDIKRYKASDMQPIIDKKYGRGTYKILTGG